MQATQSRSTHDRTPVARPNSARRCSFVQAKVSSVFMVVADIVGEKALQVALVEGNDVIQKIPPTTLNPAFSDSVLPRTLERCPNRTNSHRPHGDRNLNTILGIPIKDQESTSRLVREGLSQLLDDPKAGGVPRDIKVQDMTAIVSHDEKAVEHTERDAGDREEIHGRDRFPVVSQKGKPTFGWLGISGRSAYPA